MGDQVLLQPDEDRRVLPLQIKLIEGDLMDLPEPVKNPCAVTLLEV